MAVMPMQKLLLVTMRDDTDRMMQFTQNLQEVEIIPISDVFAVEWEGDDSGESDRLLRWEQDHERIQNAEKYLTTYTDKKQKSTNKEYLLHAPTLGELEAKFADVSYGEICQEALRCESEIRKLQDARKDNIAERDDLLFYQALPVLPEDEDFQYVETGLYRLDPGKREAIMEALVSTSTVYGEIVREDARDLVLWILFQQSESVEFDRIRQEFGLQEIHYPYSHPVADMLVRNEKQRQAIQEKIQGHSERSKELTRHLPELQIGEEVLASYIERERQKDRLLACDHVVALTGWIPVERAEEFTVACKEEFGDNVFVEGQEIQRDEPKENVPIKLKNKKLVAPFEAITEMYSLPTYDEVDPTPVMSVFYWVFFGMMVADLGYGIVTVLGTWLALKLIPFRKGMRKQIRFFHLLGYSICVWGLIYGSFFSVDLPFHLLSTTDDINAILGLSVGLGYIQILVGLGISAYMAAKEKGEKRFWNMMKGSASWLGVLLSIGVLVLGMLVLQSVPVQMAGLFLMIAFLLLLVVSNVITNRSKAKGLAYGLYDVYGITGYLGDLVSYTRLMALGIAGGSIGLAFNMIVSFLPLVARFSAGIVLLVALHALNFALSMLSAYVHGARLQYVEFFGKFYNGGGRAFSPLKAVERHFDVRAAARNGKEES